MTDSASAATDTVADPAAEAAANLEARKRLQEAALMGAVSRNALDISALLDLADFLVADDRDREAATAYRDALTLDPDDTRALLGLAMVLHRYPAFQQEAIERLQQVISLDPKVLAAYRPLAWTLDMNDRRDDAVAVLRAWKARAPDDVAAIHLLAAYADEAPPDRASDGYVQQTFDKFSVNFDVHLREALHYRGPEVLFEHLSPVLPVSASASLNILDMGCGTGLGAPLLRPIAKRLVGVDLSVGMLDKARARGLYDSLENAELTVWLGECGQRGESFDVLFAADTIIYFGRLEALLANAFAALSPGGWLAFTAEQMEPKDGQLTRDFVLATSGRYQHAKRYLNEALAEAGFLPPRVAEGQLRLESDVPEIGLIVAAMKPA